MLNKTQRIERIIARGEISDHCHAVIGEDVTIEKTNDSTLITVGEKGAVVKHILESHWLESGTETWTKEHKDIPLQKGKYKYVQQVEFNPYEETIRNVRD